MVLLVLLEQAVLTEQVEQMVLLELLEQMVLMEAQEQVVQVEVLEHLLLYYMVLVHRLPLLDMQMEHYLYNIQLNRDFL
jgi:hypothetical protein